MRLTTQIINNLIDCINEDLGLILSYNAVRAYDTKNLPVPIKKTYFSFSPYENSVNVLEHDTNYVDTNTITIRMNCYTPLTKEAAVTHNLAEVVLTYIGMEFMDYISGYSVGETTYDSDIDAYKVTCYIHFKYTVDTSAEEDGSDSSGNSSEGSSGGNDPSAADNALFQAHINNSAIHLTAAQSEYLASPVVTGTYKGLGNDSENNIILGFRPKAVIVYRRSYHPTIYTTEEAMSLNLFGFGTSNGCTKGIALTSTGFRVNQSTSGETYDTNTMLNDHEVTYVYIAFR